jgi:glutathione peroxidase-family protein
MIRRPFLNLALSGLALPLAGQGIYQNASPGSSICPQVEVDKTALNFGGTRVSPSTTAGLRGANSVVQLNSQEGHQVFQMGERKSVSTFAAYDEHAKGTSLASLKGKVVLVGLWSVRCDPSAKMLMEFASLYAKREQFGFEILAVNFDENQHGGFPNPRIELGVEGGWRAINKFKTRNRQFFETSKMPVYTPGLGKEGASNFMDVVYSLPALFVIDREGNLAQLHIGYKEGFVGEALKAAIRERPLPTVPSQVPAPAPEPTKAIQP